MEAMLMRPACLSQFLGGGGESLSSSSSYYLRRKSNNKYKNGGSRLFQSLALPSLSSSFSPLTCSKTERCVKAAASASASAAGSVMKEEDVVFVAGSTGKVGSRLVRELLKLGFRVRAGVRSSQRAGTLVQSVEQMKPLDASQSPPEERLDIVECDLEKEGMIRAAIGNASIVICCIGASEKEIFDITGPYRIDYKATLNLIQAATLAKVDRFILLTSLGTNKIGFPAAILNLFWGVLLWKRKAEEALISSGLAYTIVRPGGMERPTDAYKETHNLVLANEDTYFGGNVSNLQVAELMACMAKNRRESYCKVVEVIAETTAPLRPMEQLLATIPSQRTLPKAEPEPEPPVVVSESDMPPQLENVVVSQSKPRPQSPYAAYEDLRPPTSPTPTKPDTTTKTITEPTTTQITDTPTQSLSPYPSYDDLKPPSSPSPSAPNIDNGAPISISSSEKEAENTLDKPYHLSPYTMYEDLKPPTSPVPSVPK